MPKMICLYQTRPDNEKSKLLLRPQTLVVSAPRSSGEYLDFEKLWILSSWIPRFSIGNPLKIMDIQDFDIQNRKYKKVYRFVFNQTLE